ncbi:hypothetical protein GLYMA_03G195300v4 [Glycine max]|uniref:Protein BIC1 n=2 Tax=Glycine subgen. Soja TaxID=1462606 RepID=K7KG10_SOYBN|nr:uncharacterized protein LOC100779351 [Glycine max]XP_014628853.1 uncharacterized protein LOC100779351 isoform X5 [Glycine max]XP_028226021.1 protein BIC1-like isoform X5 [Glycine soja]XP_028226022.1 protein BIC1-like isoform X5 [Glycine soja]XP_028226023.1 protein BIC1-like isoform X5 [Glycine soja]KAH1070856.1 hypothetical protein GYH30_007747 [Glycine max]KAH1070857.1 hypothetical protein GYH30_007747 [Glycine max]KAH1070859.1 hypothetical protein GYH30_007747 [Glycine max]KAH1070862.1|eukprot:NP_001242227.2 uncharacterized protein LOC100779351 [Glycine max]
MAHQSSSSESDDHIPSHHHPLDLNSPHPSKDIIFDDNMELQQHQQEEESNINNHEYDGDNNRDKDDKDDVTTTQNPSAASETNEEKIALQEEASDDVVVEAEEKEEDSGRERLNRHRVEVAGRVWIPEIWGQEELLKDWIDCSAFDAPLVPSRISTARKALVEECTRANAAGLIIENREKTVSYSSD